MESCPPCFSSDQQYDLWREAARACWPAGGSGYCADCTPEYQSVMIAHHRCAHAGTRFVMDSDGIVEGRRNGKQ